MRYLNRIEISKIDPLSRFRQWFSNLYNDVAYDSAFANDLKKAYALGIRHALEDMNANAMNVVSAMDVKGL
jgi:hypothetical protein